MVFVYKGAFDRICLAIFGWDSSATVSFESVGEFDPSLTRSQLIKLIANTIIAVFSKAHIVEIQNSENFSRLMSLKKMKATQRLQYKPFLWAKMSVVPKINLTRMELRICLFSM